MAVTPGDGDTVKRALLTSGLVALVGLIAVAWVRVVFYGDFGPGDPVCLPGPSGCTPRLGAAYPVPDSLVGWLLLSPRDLFVALPLFAMAAAIGYLYALIMRYEVRRRVGDEAAARSWQETAWIRHFGLILFPLVMYGLLLLWRLVGVTIANNWYGH